MPALLTRIPTGPSAPATCRTASSTSARSPTSQVTASAFRPRTRISAATASSSAPVRALTATCAPSRARASAIARPMPRPPPVTSATRSESFTARSIGWGPKAVNGAGAAWRLSARAFALQSPCTAGADGQGRQGGEDRLHRRRGGGSLLRRAHEEGRPRARRHRPRAEPPGRHLRIRRGVLRRDPREIRRGRPGDPRGDRPLVRPLGRHRDPLRRRGRDLGRARLRGDVPAGAARPPAAALRAPRGEARVPGRGRATSRRTPTPT